MLRGRHRGLPVALDRAVMLPHEFRKPDEVTEQVHMGSARVAEDRVEEGRHETPSEHKEQASGSESDAVH
jgi:hypothetical protein